MELGKTPRKITEKHVLVVYDNLDIQENEKIYIYITLQLRHRTQGWHRGKLEEALTRCIEQLETFSKQWNGALMSERSGASATRTADGLRRQQSTAGWRRAQKRTTRGRVMETPKRKNLFPEAKQTTVTVWGGPAK